MHARELHHQISEESTTLATRRANSMTNMLSMLGYHAETEAVSAALDGIKEIIDDLTVDEKKILIHTLLKHTPFTDRLTILENDEPTMVVVRSFRQWLQEETKK